MGKIKVRVGVGKPLIWPQVCVLCLGGPAKQGTEVIVGKAVPYCPNCQAKVQRLRNWYDSNFMIALIIGALATLLLLIRSAIEESWLELLRFQTWLVAGAGGAIIGGVAYAIIWLLLQPLRLVFMSKLAKPGVKELKSKEPGVTVLRISNPQYAELFRQANNLP